VKRKWRRRGKNCLHWKEEERRREQLRERSWNKGNIQELSLKQQRLHPQLPAAPEEPGKHLVILRTMWSRFRHQRASPPELKELMDQLYVSAINHPL
jgi:hypothetical protein